MYLKWERRSDGGIKEVEKTMNQRPIMPPDPVRVGELSRVGAEPLYEELFQEIMTSSSPVPPHPVSTLRPRKRLPLLLAAAAVLVLLAILGLVSLAANNGLRHPTISSFRTGHAFLPESKGKQRPIASGSWQLVSAVSVISGSWQQNTTGPPPGTLTCVTNDVCYVLAGKYASPKANSPLLSESLYVSSDLGLHWLVLPVPGGFSPSTLLTCAGPSVCAAGGALNGQPILIATTDGGHQWTMTPLTNVSGQLLQLVCSSATDCHGIVGPASDAFGQGLSPRDIPNESFVTTQNGGASWVSSPLPSGDAVGEIACADVGHCLVMGTVSNGEGDVFTEGNFARMTSDGGTTWTNGTVPLGFTVSSFAGLSCADVQHCLVLGTIPIKAPNPKQCSSNPVPSPAGTQRTATTTTPPSASVEVVAGPEGRIATKANDEAAADGGGYSCSQNGTEYVSDIASTTDGGRSWTPEPLPDDAPDPSLWGVACASSNVCWASGSEAVPVSVGRVSDGGSSMLVGTTDGGSTWSKVTFSVPSGAPNAYGQSYLSIGSISCPASNTCLALGAAAQSSPTAPVYSFISAPPE